MGLLFSDMRCKLGGSSDTYRVGMSTRPRLDHHVLVHSTRFLLLWCLGGGYFVSRAVYVC